MRDKNKSLEMLQGVSFVVGPIDPKEFTKTLGYVSSVLYFYTGLGLSLNPDGSVNPQDVYYWAVANKKKQLAKRVLANYSLTAAPVSNHHILNECIADGIPPFDDKDLLDRIDEGGSSNFDVESFPEDSTAAPIQTRKDYLTKMSKLFDRFLKDAEAIRDEFLSSIKHGAGE